MVIFPTDVITDILSLLPVKTLVRFKCVSKRWGSLIDTSEFAKLHLHHSFKTNTNIKLLLNSDSGCASVDFDSMNNMEELPRPFCTEGNERGTRNATRIFGSYNGLLAVYHEASIALWNPSTRNYHYLPKLSIPDAKKGDYNILGFGYDEMRRDYVVVVILKQQGSGLVMIYSLKANSWRKIKDCPYRIPDRTQDGAYVNGSLHWYTTSLIFGLDLGAEEYHEVPDNKIDSRRYFDYMCLGVLGGSLCVSRDYDECYEVWVMKEYGVKESWSAIISDLGPGWEGNTYYRALAYSRSGKKILLDDGGRYRPAWWKLKRGGEQLVIPGAPPTPYSARTYVESPVSVLPIHH